MVFRGKAEVDLTATPMLTEIDGPNGKAKIGRLGLNSSSDFRDMLMSPCGPVEAIDLGLHQTWNIVEQTGHLVAGLISGRENANQLSGPIGIAEASGHMASRSRHLRLAPGQPDRAAFGFYRIAEFDAGAASGWWTPFVLRHRGVAWPRAE